MKPTYPWLARAESKDFEAGDVVVFTENHLTVDAGSVRKVIGGCGCGKEYC